MECKICNKNFKGKIGLNTHLRQHKIKIFEYYVKYEGLIVPKCVCGKDCKVGKIDFRFGVTCGDQRCVKQIQRKKRIRWLKDNPEKTAWRLSNLSYPEKIFKEKCEELKLNEKYLIIRERSVFPYYIDFAFENEKIAVEIDGSQHELESRKQNDIKKEDLLISQGWRVIRFTAKEIQTNSNSCFEKLNSFIISETKNERVGIFESSFLKNEVKEKLNLERQQNGGLTKKEINRSIKQRQVNRPPYNQLIQEIKDLGYSATGRKYNVSDNAIRKWVKNYEKYSV
jgi:very-short-patch-repair endonuclease